MYVEPTRLREFILDSGLVSRADLTKAESEAETSGEPLEAVLMKRGFLSKDDVRRLKAYVLGIPFISLENDRIDFETLSMIPEPIARNHNIVAFKKTPETLEVAMLDLNDLEAIDFVKKKVRLKIMPRLTDEASIKSALLQYQRSLKAEFGDLIKREAGSIQVLGGGETGEASEDDLKKLADDLPAVRVVEAVLKHAVIQNASDIHIEPMETQLLVRYRIDGILHDAMTLPRTAAESITARIKVLANLKLDEKRLPQDGRFKIDVEDQKVSIRVSILPTYYGEKSVMRLLRESASGFTLEALGFHGADLDRIHRSLRDTTGILLTTGPTGSGKTTTLYTMLDLLNTPGVNISTIEDPIEYQMPRVNQTQVKPEIGFSFGNGLRALVRQDPDIIMVGEIRDNETAALAINAALTGHLVLSTLHTNSAAGAIPRLIDMKAEPFLLVSTVRTIIAQRLVRKLCDEKEAYTLSVDEAADLRKKINVERVLAALTAEGLIKQGTPLESIPFYHPKATSECESGYKDRLGIHEVLPITSSIKELIMKDATSDAIEAQAKSEGMLTMIEDGIFKAAQGLTTIEEVLRVVSE